MYNNYNYPAGSDTPEAPWNEEILPDKEIEVTVSITLSKTVKVIVNDYIVDEDGCIDYSNCDLNKAVKEQMTLPQNAYDKLFNAVYTSESYEARGALEDLKNWNVDDFEIIKE